MALLLPEPAAVLELDSSVELNFDIRWAILRSSSAVINIINEYVGGDPIPIFLIHEQGINN